MRVSCKVLHDTIGERDQMVQGGPRHRISRDVRDVTAVRASAMAVAPCGPRLLELAWVRNERERERERER